MFPYVLAITLILFGGLAVIFLGFLQYQSGREENTKFKVGIVGEADDRYMDFGLDALKTFDETRFSMELEKLEEDEAQKALKQGKITAYLVFPEGFSEAALRGEVKSIRLITGVGASNLIMIFKEEIARAVTKIVSEAQKGVYGVQAALDSNGYEELSNQYLNKMNVEYIDFVMNRSELYEIKELGISDGLTLPQYLFCGFSVFLLLLMGLPYAIILVRSDWSLNRMLASAGISAEKQVLCEYGAYTVVMMAAAAGIMAVLALTKGKIEQLSQLDIFGSISSLAGHLAVVVVLAAAFNLMLFELSGNIIGGILLQFFCAVFLCYGSGCFYPAYTFPEKIQQVSGYLPTGLARSYLAAGIMGQSSLPALLGILAFTAGFLLITAGARRYKIKVRTV